MKTPTIQTQCLWAIDSRGRLWQINPISQRAAPTLGIRQLPIDKQYALLNIVLGMWLSQVAPCRHRLKISSKTAANFILINCGLTCSQRWRASMNKMHRRAKIKIADENFYRN